MIDGWGMNGTVEAVAFYDTSLTAAQLDAISAACAAYWADAGTPAHTFSSAARATTFRSAARTTTFRSVAR